jgi:hypothetical protein
MKESLIRSSLMQVNNYKLRDSNTDACPKPRSDFLKKALTKLCNSLSPDTKEVQSIYSFKIMNIYISN